MIDLEPGGGTAFLRPVHSRQRGEPAWVQPRHVDRHGSDPRQHLPAPAQRGRPSRGRPSCGSGRERPELFAPLDDFDALDAVEPGRHGTEGRVVHHEIGLPEQPPHHAHRPPPRPQPGNREMRAPPARHFTVTLTPHHPTPPSSSITVTLSDDSDSIDNASH
ncbi:hypothetical protein AB0G49_15315 [Streptomyces longwoodensis]|uniref:hypothetical protein n=1 Tax=Streptomyces longwoodensis TaxID=68231 RepID=UPI0034077C7F